MRVAVLSDIHGHLPALEAVLAEVDQAGVDRVVLTGDIAAGPMPVPTLQRLLSLGRYSGASSRGWTSSSARPSATTSARGLRSPRRTTDTARRDVTIASSRSSAAAAPLPAE